MKTTIAIVSVLLLPVGVNFGDFFANNSLEKSTAYDWPRQIRAANAQTVPGGDARPLPTNKNRPDFSLPDLDGTTRNIREWDGKIIVVNFWATWCAPCRKEIPVFNEIQKKYMDHGVRFLGIAMDDKKAVDRFTTIIPIEYTVLIGGEVDAIEIAQKYGNIEGILPFTVFIDRNGDIVSAVEGGISEAETEETIAALL